MDRDPNEYYTFLPLLRMISKVFHDAEWIEHMRTFVDQYDFFKDLYKGIIAYNSITGCDFFDNYDSGDIRQVFPISTVEQPIIVDNVIQGTQPMFQFQTMIELGQRFDFINGLGVKDKTAIIQGRQKLFDFWGHSEQLRPQAQPQAPT
jgi:hypothetical protein